MERRRSSARRNIRPESGFCRFQHIKANYKGNTKGSEMKGTAPPSQFLNCFSSVCLPRLYALSDSFRYRLVNKPFWPPAFLLKTEQCRWHLPFPGFLPIPSLQHCPRAVSRIFAKWIAAPVVNEVSRQWRRPLWHAFPTRLKIFFDLKNLKGKNHLFWKSYLDFLCSVLYFSSIWGFSFFLSLCF